MIRPVLVKLTTQYRLLLLKTGYVSKLSDLLGLHASDSCFKDMNLQGSFTRVGHRAAKFQTRTEGSLVPTICFEGICVIIQIIVLIIAGPFVSRIQLSIPPVLVQIIVKRNREHNCKCFVDAWNVVGNDSDNSCCDWSSGLARSVNNGKPCGK